MLGDALVILCSVFWALHIIYAGKFMEIFNIPMFYAALQAAFVGIVSLFFASILFELLHLIIPNRAFELNDLFANILGVLLAFFIFNLMKKLMN